MTNGFDPKQKKAGDLIQSADWNAAMDEIDRLGKTLQDIKQKATSFHGPLTIEDALKVKGNVGIGTDNPTAKLEVKGNLKLEFGEAVNEFSSDITLADNSNQAVPTELAVKTYVDKQVQGLQESFTSKKLEVSQSLKLGNGVEVAQFSNTISPSRDSSLVVVPTEQAIITYIKSTLEKFGLVSEIFFDLGNGVILEMQPIKAGSFLMGSPDNEFGRDADEGPQHQVNVPAFWMGKYQVTQQQWQAVASYKQVDRSLNAEPSKFKGESLPVEQVSWYEAKEFCARVNQKLEGQL
ncbi:MAG: formylglycine-generating enzyme family protein, partial [Moorea sp. SIO3I7]|nr:formylglycine-generating enzyme family protein [Moorena sp. SIO3I7]